MRVKHDTHYHEVDVVDDGTMDTVLNIDGHEVRYMEADRWPETGQIRRRWLIESAFDACDDGLLSEDADVDPDPEV